MKHSSTDPRYEFRVFGQDFGPYLTPLLTSSTPKRRLALAALALPIVEHRPATDEGRQTYLLAHSGQNCAESYSVKIRNHKVDTKVLLRYQQGLERWQPHLQLAFPLTAAFLHEFLFAWLELAPPHLRRPSYTETQFLQELIAQHPLLCAVTVHKQRQTFTVNDCALEVTALTVNERHHTHTIAVEADAAEKVLETVEFLGLHSFTNTNYPVGLSQLLRLNPSAAMAWSGAELAPPTSTPELVLVR